MASTNQVQPLSIFFRSEDMLDRDFGEGFCNELIGFINEQIREKYRKPNWGYVEIGMIDVLNRFPILSDMAWRIPQYVIAKFKHEGWSVNNNYSSELAEYVFTFETE